VHLPSQTGLSCSDATSDQSGNVAAQSLALNQSGVWQFFAADGTATGSVDRIQGDLFPQGKGFEGSRFTDGGGDGFVPNQSVKVAPDGTVTTGVFINGDENGSATFRGWPDGMLVVTQSCGLGPPGSVDVARFAEDGSIISQAISTGGGCAFLTAASASGGVTLVLFGGDNPAPNLTRGRWYGADGAPTGDFFTVSPDTILPATALRVLVNGDIALSSGGHWLGVFAANGGTALEPAPAWLEDDHDFTIVRGEKAYALIPRTGSLNHLDLVSAKGDLCGTVTFPGVAGLTTGADGTVIGAGGTVIGAGGSDGCTKTWWSGLLK
jgi:hypothetical protein